MGRIMRYETRILGVNFLIIALCVFLGTLIVLITSGDLVNKEMLSFEVILPFAFSLMIGISVRTRSDPAFDLILTTRTSLFTWIMKRYLCAFLSLCIIVAIGLIPLFISGLVTNIMNVLLAFLATAFFLSSLGIASSFLGTTSYIAAAVSGLYWALNLLKAEWFQGTIMRQIYLFAGFSSASTGELLLNKASLIMLGAICWIIVYFVCRKRLIFSK